MSFAARLWPFHIQVRRISMSSSEVRQSFIKFFENNGHTHVPSSSVIPDDESLLFTTAGMNQFKSIFLDDPNSQWKGLRKAVSYQKCIRAGGKHNDLDDVGHDLHHQTFFEMLGNWSFNESYNKEEACRFAWGFLVDVLKIDSKRLYVTYFGGNSSLPADIQCKNIWKKLGVPSHKIIPFDEENFWEMGYTGPSGMCTEIHYDRIANREDVPHLVNRDNSVIELWNLVFMDMIRRSDGKLDRLSNSHIDTGMGFERLVSVVQNVKSNYDTDLFHPFINKLCQLSNKAYTGSSSSKSDAAMRLVSDHIRACTIAINDGVLPSGKGAGFVVRKMLRRAFLQSTSILGISRETLTDLVPIVVETLESGYPELQQTMINIQTTITKEERNFWQIVESGKKIYDKLILKLDLNSDVLPGSLIWDLHNTHGLSIDITAELARASGKTMDLDGFNQLREAARNLSKRTSNFP